MLEFTYFIGQIVGQIPRGLVFGHKVAGSKSPSSASWIHLTSLEGRGSGIGRGGEVGWVERLGA